MQAGVSDGSERTRTLFHKSAEEKEQGVQGCRRLQQPRRTCSRTLRIRGTLRAATPPAPAAACSCCPGPCLPVKLPADDTLAVSNLQGWMGIAQKTG